MTISGQVASGQLDTGLREVEAHTVEPAPPDPQGHRRGTRIPVEDMAPVDSGSTR